MIGMPSLRDMALYNGVIGAISKLFMAWFINLLTTKVLCSQGNYPPIIVGIYPQLEFEHGQTPVELLTLDGQCPGWHADHILEVACAECGWNSDQHILGSIACNYTISFNANVL